MFFEDHKKAVGTIMSKRGPKGEVTMDKTPMKPEIVKDEEGEMDGKHLAAQDIMAAHHSGSADKLKHALGNFVDLHMAGNKKEEG